MASRFDVAEWVEECCKRAAETGGVLTLDDCASALQDAMSGDWDWLLGLEEDMEDMFYKNVMPELCFVLHKRGVVVTDYEMEDGYGQ